MRKRPSIRQMMAPDPGVKPSFQNNAQRMYNDTIVDSNSTDMGFNYLLGALRSRAPGQNTANVLELARHLTSGVFVAINTLCNHARSAERKVFEKTHDPKFGDKEIPDTEPVFQLLNDPNNDDDWADIMEDLTKQMKLTGSALLWLPGFEDGYIPSEMYVIPTATALPWPPSPIYQHGSYLVQPFYPLNVQRQSSAMAA